VTNTIKAPKKLIEVALPLKAINAAAATEKSIRHGHPSTLHLYWARRPLAAARAVLFGQMVNDPSWRWEMEHPGEVPPNNLKATWAKSRQRLFKILEELVTWKNSTNEIVLDRARNEIRKSWKETCELNCDHPLAAELFNPERLPEFHDPFAGGGAIPIEAQRLGLATHASDLNPVAVLLNRAMLDLPQRFSGAPPVNPNAHTGGALLERRWMGSLGLADDIRYYGACARDASIRRVGHLYPPVVIDANTARDRADLQGIVGRQPTVIAWIWARTVRSPNPAFADVHVPLATTFVLSSKVGREAYIEPVVAGREYYFRVLLGAPPDAKKTRAGTKLGKGSNFQCLLSGAPISAEYIRDEAQGGRLGARMLAIVAEGNRERLFLPATADAEIAACAATSEWKPDTAFYQQALGFRIGNYGLTKWSDLYTNRQLAALTTFAEVVRHSHERIEQDALAQGMSSDPRGVAQGGVGARAYAETVQTYLGFGVSRSADYWSSLCIWRSDPKNLGIGHVFSEQKLSMVWDYAEANPFSESSGNWTMNLSWVAKVVDVIGARIPGTASQNDAQTVSIAKDTIISTDPPYYDNVGYADLSDFFYVWLRASLREIYPDLFATLTTPKADELVATPGRHGGSRAAETFFLNGMSKALGRIGRAGHPAFPTTVYYAFKQSERDQAGITSTGWQTFLESLVNAGLSITGTWPMQTEMGNRTRSMDANALASSVILVCRPRPTDAVTISRREFTKELGRVLPEALDAMTRGAEGWGAPVAPVDLSQAIIGPGMEVFTKYAAVLEADGSPMTARTALMLINRYLADDEFDTDTQYCLAWFEQYGWNAGPFGVAETLARAKGTSVDGIRSGGVLSSAGGAVRLTRPAEYVAGWDPRSDGRAPVWELLHQLIRTFRSDGEQAAAALLGLVQVRAASARQLAYRLYTLCERSGWAEDARAYNELIASWSAIESAAPQIEVGEQHTLFEPERP
jgi:putative DNA methylase